MDQAQLPNLSPSERRTLEYVGDGEFHASDLDWVALQRLKQIGLCEDGLGGRPKLTAEGRRVLRQLQRPS